MPAPGDQHKQPNGSVAQNPFEEQKPHISEFTAQEIATLTSRLNKRLGPEYVSTRAGPGNTRVAYLSAEKAINLANEVFGFNGWSSSIQNIQIDFVDENTQKGTISIGLSVVVRVTLKDGTYHEDIGYGGIENCKSKIAAFEKAKKEGTTDALKRALRNFGNVLGNCIYDKDYITKVSKIKTSAGKFDVNDLYRHQDFAPRKEEERVKPAVNSIPPPQPPALVAEESFDVNDFDDADLADLGNPDEVMLPPETGGQPRGPDQQNQSIRLLPNHQITPSKPLQNKPEQQTPFPSVSSRQPLHLRNGGPIAPETHPQPQSRSSSPGVTCQNFTSAPPQAPPGQPSIGFFSARAADGLDGNNNPTGGTVAPKFDPYTESPSIRKTSGVDHTKSVALNRNTLKPEPFVPREEQPQAQLRTATDQRRPGQVPGGFSPVGAGKSPGGVTSAYRPPTRYGPANQTANGPAQPLSGDRALAASKRAPLGELNNVQHHPNGASKETGDAKRPRIGSGLSGNSENATAPG